MLERSQIKHMSLGQLNNCAKNTLTKIHRDLKRRKADLSAEILSEVISPLTERSVEETAVLSPQLPQRSITIGSLMDDTIVRIRAIPRTSIHFYPDILFTYQNLESIISALQTQGEESRSLRKLRSSLKTLAFISRRYSKITTTTRHNSQSRQCSAADHTRTGGAISLDSPSPLLRPTVLLRRPEDQGGSCYYGHPEVLPRPETPEAPRSRTRARSARGESVPRASDSQTSERHQGRDIVPHNAFTRMAHAFRVEEENRRTISKFSILYAKRWFLGVTLLVSGVSLRYFAHNAATFGLIFYELNSNYIFYKILSIPYESKISQALMGTIVCMTTAYNVMPAIGRLISNINSMLTPLPVGASYKSVCLQHLFFALDTTIAIASLSSVVSMSVLSISPILNIAQCDPYSAVSAMFSFLCFQTFCYCATSATRYLEKHTRMDLIIENTVAIGLQGAGLDENDPLRKMNPVTLLSGVVHFAREGEDSRAQENLEEMSQDDEEPDVERSHLAR